MSCEAVPLFLFIEGGMMSCGWVGLWGARPGGRPPIRPPGPPSLGFSVADGGPRRVRLAVGGAGITIPAEADRGHCPL